MAKKFEYDSFDQDSDIQAFINSVKIGFSGLDDPRASDNQTYSLISLIIMILGATIAGANSISGIYQYARIKEDMFIRLLGIPRAPSYRAFWWFLTLMNPKPFQTAFFNWISSLSAELKNKLIATLWPFSKNSSANLALI